MFQFLPMLASAMASGGNSGMIGGQGLSTGGDAMGPAGALSNGLFNSLTSGGMFGSVNRGNSNSSGTSRFDASQIPLFNQQLAQTDQASKQLMEFLRLLGGQRTDALRADLDKQMASVQGMGQQALSDINQRYNSAQGGVGQRLASTGLYNSTVAPGMQALVNRERNAALGQEQDRQRQYFGGLLGQRAQLLDRSLADQNQALAQVGSQDYQLRQLLPAQIANSRVSAEQTKTREKRGGWLSGIFGR